MDPLKGIVTFTPVQAIPSPCVNICRVEAGRCTGCRRTLDEIARWTAMPAAERDRVMAELPGR